MDVDDAPLERAEKIAELLVPTIRTWRRSRITSCSTLDVQCYTRIAPCLTPDVLCCPPIARCSALSAPCRIRSTPCTTCLARTAANYSALDTWRSPRSRIAPRSTLDASCFPRIAPRSTLCVLRCPADFSASSALLTTDRSVFNTQRSKPRTDYSILDSLRPRRAWIAPRSTPRALCCPPIARCAALRAPCRFRSTTSSTLRARPVRRFPRAIHQTFHASHGLLRVPHVPPGF